MARWVVISQHSKAEFEGFLKESRAAQASVLAEETERNYDRAFADFDPDVHTDVVDHKRDLTCRLETSADMAQSRTVRLKIKEGLKRRLRGLVPDDWDVEMRVRHVEED